MPVRVRTWAQKRCMHTWNPQLMPHTDGPQRTTGNSLKTLPILCRTYRSHVMSARIHLFAILLGTIINNTFASPGNFYDPLTSPRLVEFKRTIGYENALAMERIDQEIIVNWDNFPTPPDLEGWNLEKSSNLKDDGTRYLRLSFTQKDAQVSISVDVYDPRNNKAGESLLLKANAVTTMAITDTRGPRDLGTLSLISSAKPTDLVYWIYRNVFAEVSTYKTNVSALSIARWLQKQMDINTR